MIYGWSRDDAFEVCLEVLATGCIGGVPVDANLEALATGLGRPFEQNYTENRLNMWRDWGLLQCNYHRDALDSPWQCAPFEVCTHRMKKPFKWRPIAAELERHGYEARFVADFDDDINRYDVPASGAVARVGRTDYYIKTGRLSNVSITAYPLLWATRAQWGPWRNDLRGLLKAGSLTWPAWLAQRQPTAEDFAALLHAVVQLLGSLPPRDDEWMALGLWLLEQAREAGVWSNPEWVYRWAHFVTTREDTLPAREVARTCLAALPMTPTEATELPNDWRQARPEDVHRARMTRALLNVAVDHSVPETTDALQPWQSLVGWLR